MKNLIEKLDSSIILQVLSLVLLLVLAATSGSQAAQVSSNAQINRYVIAVSANYGGEGRPVLRYAESDAKSFAKVLGEMGGVQSGNVILVKEPGVAGLQKHFDGLDSKIAQNKNSSGRNEVLFYYSGHADEKGLRLGKEVYAWKELRKRIDAMKADVKIAVIDACGSGAITRLKGGVAVPAFMVDQSSDMKGYAFITSSTQDESSQESDKLKGSFFTHSLVSGLRGAGDLSGDGKVTLSEAYQFTFNETLQKTETTLGGAQHPSRDMNLAGTGDVVMTDLRSTSAGLELDEDVDGRLFIRDEKGVLVAELYKKSGRAMSLGFPAGTYTVRLERPAEYKETTVTLQDNYRARLSQKQFAAVSAEKTTLRGSVEFKSERTCAAGDTNQCSLDSLDRSGTSHTTFNLYDHDKEPRKGVQIGLFATRSEDYFIGSQLSLFVNSANKDMRGLQVTGLLNLAENVDGAQISGTLNYAESFQGLQLGFVNLVNDKSDGVQIGYVNAAFDTLGSVQVGFVDLAKQVDVQVGFVDVAGSSDVQVGFVNVAPKADVEVGFVDVAGKSDVQVGFTNVSYKQGGTQVGYVNTATHSKGRQVGFVNVCLECEKTPIGFVSIVGNGVWSATSSINEMGALGISLHLGTAYFYTAFEGARLFEEGSDFSHFSDTWESGVGFGTQFGSYGSHFELEYTHFNTYDRFRMNDVDWGHHHRLRLGYVYRLLPGIGLGVGGTMNVATQGKHDNVLLKPLGEYHDDVGSNNHKGRVWPGFYSAITVGRF